MTEKKKKNTRTWQKNKDETIYLRLKIEFSIDIINMLEDFNIIV